METETKEELMTRLGLTGIGLEHHSKHYTENSEDGVISHKRVDFVYEDGVLLVKKIPHRQVLETTQGDYSEKLAIVNAGVMGTLAIEQLELIKQKDIANNGLAELNNTLALRLEEEKVKSGALALELKAVKKQRDDLLTKEK